MLLPARFCLMPKGESAWAKRASKLKLKAGGGGHKRGELAGCAADDWLSMQGKD